jgi:membrane-associated phospholipid phosphatase
MDQSIQAQFDADLFRRRCWGLLLLATVAFAMLAPFDVSIAQLCYRMDKSAGIAKFLEVFADIAGGPVPIILTLIVITTIFSRRHFRNLPILLTLSLGSGLIVDGLKLCICRARPYTVDLGTATFGSTFGGLFPLFSAGSRGQSFPSGHSATAVGFAVALAILYPRGRWVYAASALLVMASRVHRHAHFPTDVVAGAGVGVAWALVCTSPFAGVAFGWFDQHVFSKARIRRLAPSEVGEALLPSESIAARDSSPNERNAA